jgi:hypothetical protein
MGFIHGTRCRPTLAISAPQRVRCILLSARSCFDGYFLGSYRKATAPEPTSSWLTSFKC